MWVKATCETCKFFRTDSDELAVGRCVRNPPTLVVDTGHGAWPYIRKVEWCGEHKSKAFA